MTKRSIVENTLRDIEALNNAIKTNRHYGTSLDRASYMRKYRAAKRWEKILAVAGQTLECPECHTVVTDSKKWVVGSGTGLQGSSADGIVTCKSCYQKGTRTGVRASDVVFSSNCPLVDTAKLSLKVSLLVPHARQRRIEAEYTIASLAEELNITESQVEAIERGTLTDIGLVLMYVDRVIGIYGLSIECNRGKG